MGVTGGMVPCPAALVVLLSAVALHRIAFGLFLIAAFSVGLAAVLISIGLLMVYAGQFVSRLHGDGPLMTRWLPLVSAAVITALGLAIAVRALVAAGLNGGFRRRVYGSLGRGLHRGFGTARRAGWSARLTVLFDTWWSSASSGRLSPRSRSRPNASQSTSRDGRPIRRPSSLVLLNP
ncbi:MAG: hypothetical protein DMG26_21195, partial [Acidobacteria bacterium]